MSLALNAPDGVRYLCERVYGDDTMLSGLTGPQSLYLGTIYMYSHTSPRPWLLRALPARGNDIVSGLTSPQTLNYIISGCLAMYLDPSTS